MNDNQCFESLFLLHDIETFLYAEAAMLDERQFEDWLDLLTEDVRYSMPLRRNVKFGEPEWEDTKELQEMAWFDEGKATLTQRVKQINTGEHWAEEPFSRVCHMITNVRIIKVALPEVTVESRFLLYRNRLQDETDFFIGKREDILRKVDGQWKIARRKIILDQNVLLAKNLTVFF